MIEKLQFFKQIDIFSKSFVFYVEHSKNKSSAIGGILSLGIFVVSFLYLYYLLNLYFTNQIQPKINQSSSITSNRIDIQIQENQIMFEYFIQGKPLRQFEKELGKNLLTYSIVYNQFFKNGKHFVEEISISQCKDERFQEYLCFDKAAISNRKLISDPLQFYASNYEILIQPCNSQKDYNCATQEQIFDLIFTSQNFFQFYTKMSSYNSTSKAYEDQYKYGSMYLDPNQFIMSRYNFIQAQTTVMSGLIIQSSEQKQTIYNYERIDSVLSFEKIEARLGKKGYCLIQYALNQEQNIIIIQFPMVTEVLAQFTSIFNFLLSFGILARIIAGIHIIEEINNILLKTYYKKTAVKLLRNNDNQSLKKKNSSDKSKKILTWQEKINEVNFAQSKKQFFKFGLFERFKLFIFHILNRRYSHRPKLNEDPKSIFSKLQKLSIDRINIFQFFKDILELKMAIKLILTKEQYSAIQFCGSEIIEENKLKNQLLKNNSKKLNTISFSQTKVQSQINDKGIINFKEVNSVKQIIPFNQGETQLLKNSKLSSLNQQSQSTTIKCQINTSLAEQNFSNDNFFETQNEFYLKSQFSPKFFFEQNIYSPKISILKPNQGDIAVDMKDSQQLNDLQQQVNIKEKENNAEGKNKENFNFSQKNTFNNSSLIQKSDPIFSEQISHLQEMDLIEQNYSVSSQYFKKFLEQIANNPEDMTQIDKQIFQSLLVDDQDSLLSKS